MTTLYKAEITYVKHGEKQVRSFSIFEEWIGYDQIQKLVRDKIVLLREKNDICRVIFFEQKIDIKTFDLEEDE